MFAVFLLSGAMIVEPAAPPMPVYADTTDRGFVFMDGEYLPPPYMVVQTEDALAVNGRVVRADFGNERRVRESGLELAASLEQHSVVVLNSREPIVSINSGTEVEKFLQVMTSDDASVRNQASRFDQNGTWDNWLDEFHPPKRFVTLANRRLKRMRKVRDATLEGFRNRHAAANSGYVLTIIGMVLGVWALGHLLSSSPRPEDVASAAGANPALLRATRISIVAVFVLSGLDLVWTLVASSAGQMREMNPLGSQLIENPVWLVAFKVTATLIGCGVLYAMRHHHRARKAAWWMCLVMTVLTFRWLVFNSMHVAA